MLSQGSNVISKDANAVDKIEDSYAAKLNSEKVGKNLRDLIGGTVNADPAASNQNIESTE